MGGEIVITWLFLLISVRFALSPPISYRTLIPNSKVPYRAEKTAFRESPETLHVNFQGGIIHHFLCAPAIRVPSIRMGDKYQQLIPVRLLKFDVLLIAHLGILKTVDDVKIGAFMFIHPFTKLGYRFAVK